MAAKHNIVLDQGSDYILNFNFERNNAPLVLTGYSIRGHIRPTPSSSTLTGSFTGTTVNAATGSFRISLSATTSAAITAGLYYYDVELYNGALVTRVLQGTLQVTQEVTR